MQSSIAYIKEIIDLSIRKYLMQEGSEGLLTDIALPEEDFICIADNGGAWNERIVLLLALLPHHMSEALDVFFLKNQNYDRGFTEFGGIEGVSHRGFIPTGQTAAFILSQANVDMFTIYSLFGEEHWFYKTNTLKLTGQNADEPFLSGKLTLSTEFLNDFYGIKHNEGSNDTFSLRIATDLEWDDLVLSKTVMQDINNVLLYIKHHHEAERNIKLAKFIKPGFRTLFYGASGTGKTLTAMLLAKSAGLDIFRVNLLAMVSKYIGETEKNISDLFERAERKNQVLFFDNADILFKGISAQEKSLIYQKIKDFRGFIIMTSTSISSFEDEYNTIFQMTVHFSLPDKDERRKLLSNVLPEEWLIGNQDKLIDKAASYNLSGGSIINIVRYCAIHMVNEKSGLLTMEILENGIKNEKYRLNDK